MLVEALVEWAVVGSGGQWWAVVGACTLEMRVLSTVHGVGSLSLLAIFAANCTWMGSGLGLRLGLGVRVRVRVGVRVGVGVRLRVRVSLTPHRGMCLHHTTQESALRSPQGK